MKIYTVRGYQSYLKHINDVGDEYSEHLRLVDQFRPQYEASFHVPGYSYPAQQNVQFECDFKYSQGFPDINWRERLVCPKTHLNNRTRSCIHLSDLYLNLYQNSRIYLMEQVTPLYSYLKRTYPNLIGSEYLGANFHPGEIDKRGIRNEDVTRLSFDSETLDAIMSFDVFEHVPEYKKAFSECHRTLKPGGSMLFSVPFAQNEKKNIIRAVVEKDGSIHHIMKPEYHGDPVSERGILCFQHFGWEVIEDLLNAGFEDAFALVFWSLEFGYFTQQIQFVAKKAE